MDVGKYCTPDPVTIHVDASVREAAQRMRDEGVGCLVVIERADELVGIVTDRDLATRVVAKPEPIREVRVGQVMSAPVICLDAEDPLDLACETMRTRGVRRLPVIARQRLVGILALDDVLGLLAQGLDELRWQRLEKNRRCSGRTRSATESRSDPAGTSPSAGYPEASPR